MLLRSFLALTVKYSDDDFFKDSKNAAVEFYIRSSRELIFSQMGDSNAAVNVLTACCLLSLHDIADSNKVRAWMTTGIAVRLAISTSILTSGPGRSILKKPDALQRCCWSLFILDKIYNSSFQTLPAIPEEAVMPDKPVSPPTPHTASDEGLEYQRMLHNTGQVDEGVTSYFMQLLSAWGSLMVYLKNIRQGQLEDAWSPNSAYQQIKSLVFRFETVLPEVHRFRNTKFHERNESERSTARNYWAAWISMQMVYHVIQCILHHPFLHLAEIHRKQRLRSPSFLQHATDQAILHSAWVIRILDLCMDHNFAVYDPFVGHLAAMTATVLFFLRFSRDGTLATKAAKDFEVCQRFVDRMADENPHLQHTKSKLTRLAQSTTQEIQPPKVETSLLWDLLDYAASSNPSESTGSSSAVELNVNTQFLSSPQANTPRPNEVFPSQDQAGMEVSMTDFQVWDDASLTFDMVDFSTLPDVTALNMPISWSNGHL
ncbi:hypothetical protein LTR84_002473 [Exophiala bonariae]|uniref:Xylanolytic transcriptional activator regulatory domain-containing protein n=1 Tax=Exophiala bonariae TaxID=1690606 RepID=A0AAV9NAY0_9EURO|nr:hypothetical protein LTR84_002473 [Exophiala bonariae]